MVEMDRFKHKRLMCLDIGKKRIGIAVCDILHITTTPLTTIEVSSDFIKKIIQIIEKENPAAIIIGMPEASKGQVNFTMNRLAPKMQCHTWFILVYLKRKEP